MVNGFGKLIDSKVAKIDLGINLSKPINLFGKNKGADLKLKPIDFGPSFNVTSKQGIIKPIKQSGTVSAAKVKSAQRELAAAQQIKGIDANEATARVQAIMNGGQAITTDLLENSQITKPTASKLREQLRNEQKGLLNKINPAFSQREFQVAFVSDAGIVTRRNFTDENEAQAFRQQVEAEGRSTFGSPITLREVRV